MVKLFCAVVGVQGSAFPVDIDASLSVGDLKDAIKTKNKIKLKNIDASDLQLFLAKPKDGPWLRSDDSDVIRMRSGAIPEQVKKLLNEQIDPAAGIGALFGDAKPTMEIHVLVRVPDYDSDSEVNQQRKLTSFQKLRKESGATGELPVQGDFMKLFDLTDDDIGKVLNIKAIGDIVGFTGSDFYTFARPN
eukprot:jgi/Phyca11/128353/e_gw1.75.129.1